MNIQVFPLRINFENQKGKKRKKGGREGRQEEKKGEREGMWMDPGQVKTH